MTPERQREKIAELCGWTRLEEFTYNGKLLVIGINPDGEEGDFPSKEMSGERRVWKDPCPDYLNSLDAMHQVEEILGDKDFDYQDELAKVTGAGDAATEWYESYSYRVLLIRATAAQRAEAFLRTMNAWEN